MGGAGLGARTLAVAAAAVACGAGWAGAEPFPEGLAERLTGCWAAGDGGRLTFTPSSDGGLDVVLDGFCAAGASPAASATWVSETGRVCFWAQVGQPGDTAAFCVEWPAEDEAPLLLRLRWDHDRILSNRTRGTHPLETASSERLARCP